MHAAELIEDQNLSTGCLMVFLPAFFIRVQNPPGHFILDGVHQLWTGQISGFNRHSFFSLSSLRGLKDCGSEPFFTSLILILLTWIPRVIQYLKYLVPSWCSSMTSQMSETSIQSNVSCTNWCQSLIMVEMCRKSRPRKTRGQSGEKGSSDVGSHKGNTKTETPDRLWCLRRHIKLLSLHAGMSPADHS